jgi:hypothetical protein
LHTDTISSEDGQITQVGPDPLDYLLRYAAGDYDCYYQGRYIGSRATLPKAIEAVKEEQAKAARHPQPSPAADTSIAAYHDELRAIAARLHDSWPAIPPSRRRCAHNSPWRTSASPRRSGACRTPSGHSGSPGTRRS